MKLYYLEHDLFPATYNFKDDTVGSFPSGWTDGDTTGCETTIISSFDGHRKVMQQYDNGVGRCYARKDIIQGLNTTIEFYLTKNSIAPHTSVHMLLYEDATQLFSLTWEDDDLDGLGVGSIKDDFLVANILSHFKIVFNDTANTYDVYIDGILAKANCAYFLNSTSGVNRLYFVTDNADTGYYGYIDAIGISTDLDYNIGDNRNVDWHDPYNKERITDIDTYPIITPRLNTYCQCNAILGDFEGAKFDDWYARDFNKILIEDDSSNIIFRGFLIKKIFTKKSLTLYFAGIGALLDYKHFGDMGIMDYILAEGKVDLPIEATSILTLKKDAGGAMGWDADWWIKEGKDVGILIVDKTDVNTRAWDSSAISQEGGTVKLGNNASTLGFLDNDYYSVRDNTVGNPDMIITPTIDGIVVDDTDFLKSIEVQFCFRMKIFVGIFSRNYARCRFQILKDTTWITIASVDFDRYWGSHTSNWVIGVPKKINGEGEVGGNDAEWFAPDDTDIELRKYFNKDNGHYSELKGMRFILNGDIKNNGYVEVHVDYIKVKVGYDTDDISPIMETITDSAASTITCSNVAKWDEMGVVENDGFKIGQNTRVIIQDIAKESGINIEIIDPHDETESDITILCNTDSDCNWVLILGANHNIAVSDDVGATYVAAGVGETGTIEQFGMATTTLTSGYVHKIRVYLYGKTTASNGPTATIWNGVSWETPIEVPFTAVNTWKYVEFTGLYLGQGEIDDLLLKLTAPTIEGEEGVVVIEIKVHVYEAYPNINKYMAREFKGSYCIEALKAICKLEGAHWYEDYINDKIVVVKPADLVDSGVDLTEANYNGPWEYNDECNQVKSFIVYGKSEDSIVAKAIDETVNSPISKYLIDESITNIADAQFIADTQLALLNSKRPSIRLPLKVDNIVLQVGKTIDITFARPTIAKTSYIIRKLERKRRGINDIALTIWVGMGESTREENDAKFIRDNMLRSHKALTDRLISP